MKEYRISKNREEIIKVIQKKIEAENLVTIWQKDPKTGERKFKCDVRFSSFDPHEGIFSIRIPDDMINMLNWSLECYFLFHVEDFVFKTKPSMVQPGKRGNVNFIIPFDVRLEEHRLQPRLYIDQSDKRFVAVTFRSKNIKEEVIEVNCPVYNISTGGICIIITKETLSSINLNQPIALEGLSFYESLSNQMSAIVKNARVYAKKGIENDECYALGLQFYV